MYQIGTDVGRHNMIRTPRRAVIGHVSVSVSVSFHVPTSTALVGVVALAGSLLFLFGTL